MHKLEYDYLKFPFKSYPKVPKITKIFAKFATQIQTSKAMHFNNFSLYDKKIMNYQNKLKSKLSMTLVSLSKKTYQRWQTTELVIVRSRYTASQKHESTLLHTYVLNEFLTAYRFHVQVIFGPWW